MRYTNPRLLYFTLSKCHKVPWPHALHRNVFSKRLNCSRLWHCLRLIGSEFHSRGAAAAKHLSPKSMGKGPQIETVAAKLKRQLSKQTVYIDESQLEGCIRRFFEAFRDTKKLRRWWCTKSQSHNFSMELSMLGYNSVIFYLQHNKATFLRLKLTIKFLGIVRAHRHRVLNGHPNHKPNPNPSQSNSPSFITLSYSGLWRAVTAEAIIPNPLDRIAFLLSK